MSMLLETAVSGRIDQVIKVKGRVRLPLCRTLQWLMFLGQEGWLTKKQEGLVAAFDWVNADHEGYDEAGYDCFGYDRDGYDCSGYNACGRDRYGCDRSGYNDLGYDRDGYDRAGFDRWGRDRQGYNRRGYNILGFDRQGYDRTGFNREGYDREWYDREGFNHLGRDRQGYDRWGFSLRGRSRDGAFRRPEVELTCDELVRRGRHRGPRPWRRVGFNDAVRQEPMRRNWYKTRNRRGKGDYRCTRGNWLRDPLVARKKVVLR